MNLFQMFYKTKFYGQAIDTSDSRPYVVAEKEFKTLAEARAYAQGVSDAADNTDYEEMHGETSLQPSEDE